MTQKDFDFENSRLNAEFQKKYNELQNRKTAEVEKKENKIYDVFEKFRQSMKNEVVKKNELNREKHQSDVDGVKETCDFEIRQINYMMEIEKINKDAQIAKIKHEYNAEIRNIDKELRLLNEDFAVKKDELKQKYSSNN